MQGPCRYMPTVEGCQATADRYIEDYCLRDCVRRLCALGKPKCDEDEPIRLHCATRKAEGKDVAGYVPPWTVDKAPRSCEQPEEEFGWCQLPLSPPCQELNMVHELAHACGWHHGEGKGVPGNNDKGEIRCR
jgi:hypothetical protein